MPWSLRPQATPLQYELPNAHAANQAIVRIDVHESLDAAEARDLVVAVKKITQYYRASKRSTVTVEAGEAVNSTA
jgi:hypothetical protein